MVIYTLNIFTVIQFYLINSTSYYKRNGIIDQKFFYYECGIFNSNKLFLILTWQGIAAEEMDP